MKRLKTLTALLLIASTMVSFAQDKLELYLPFNDSIVDESHNQYDINYFKVSTINDRNGIANSCVSFGFSDSSRVEVHEEIIDLNEDFTISSWFYKQDSLSYAKYILTSRLNEYGLEQGGADLRILNDTILKFTLRSSYPMDEVYNIQYNNLEPNKWYFVTIVKENNNLKLYLNNVLIDKVGPENNRPITNNANWSIGAIKNTEGWFRPFYGFIDDIRIYSEALPTQAVNDLYLDESIYLDKITIIDTVYVQDTSYIAVTDTLLIDLKTNYLNSKELTTIKVYPNPAVSEVNIDFGNIENLIGYSYSIVSIDARIVSKGLIEEQFLTIKVTEFGDKGLYLFSIIAPDNSSITTRKILIE